MKKPKRTSPHSNRIPLPFDTACGGAATGQAEEKAGQAETSQSLRPRLADDQSTPPVWRVFGVDLRSISFRRIIPRQSTFSTAAC